MKEQTIDALDEALQAIANQFMAIQSGKGEKFLSESLTAIQGARDALQQEEIS